MLAVCIISSKMPVRISHRNDLPKRIIDLLGRGVQQSEIARKLGVSRQYVSQVATPVKVYARGTLHTAIQNGSVMVPEACQSCGDGGKLHGHHTNYLDALSVEWLCKRCHYSRHSDENYRPGTRVQAKSQALPSAVASALARRRWENVSAEDRSAHGRKMAAARKAKRGTK